jgi:hypothetical protein
VPELFQRWSEQHGDAFTVKLDTRWLVLSDPKAFKVSFLHGSLRLWTTNLDGL